MSDLDAALIAAHHDRDGPALVELYEHAAAQSTDPDATAFFLTHAYIHALEQGAPAARHLKAKLISLGRDIP